MEIKISIKINGTEIELTENELDQLCEILKGIKKEVYIPYVPYSPLNPCPPYTPWITTTYSNHTDNGIKG